MERSLAFFYLLALIIVDGNSQASCLFSKFFKNAWEKKICESIFGHNGFIEMWKLETPCVDKMLMFQNQGVKRETIELVLGKMRYTEPEKCYNSIELIKLKGWDDDSIKGLLTHIDAYLQKNNDTGDEKLRADLIELSLSEISVNCMKTKGNCENIDISKELHYLDIKLLDNSSRHLEAYRKWTLKENNSCDRVVAWRIFSIFSQYDKYLGKKSFYTEDFKIKMFDVVCLNKNWNRKNTAFLDVVKCALVHGECLTLVLELIFEKMPVLKNRCNEAGWGTMDVIEEVTAHCDSLLQYRTKEELAANAMEDATERAFDAIVDATTIKLKRTVFLAIVIKTSDEYYNCDVVNRKALYGYLTALTGLLGESKENFSRIDDYNKYMLIYEITKYFNDCDSDYYKKHSPVKEIREKECAAERAWAVERLVELGNSCAWKGPALRAAMAEETQRKRIKLPRFKQESGVCASLVKSFSHKPGK